MATRISPLTKGLNKKIYLRKDGKLQGLIEIPPDLQFAYGRKKIVKSLKTVDPHEANRRYALMVAKAEAGFRLLRQGPSSQDFEQFAIWLHGYQAAETAASAERNLVSRYDSMDPYSSIQMGKLLDSQQPQELLATVGWAADSFYRDKLGDDFDGLADVIRGSAGYRQVLRDCALVLKDSWRAGREALLGRTVSPPRSPALNAKPEESPDGNRAKADNGRWRIRRYFEEVYLPRSLGTLGAGAVGVKRQTIALFNELIGDPPLYLVSQSQIADFQAQLKMLPDGRLIGQLRQTMTVKQIVAAQIAGTLTVKRLAAGTINKHVMNVKTILRFARAEGHILLNPSLDMISVKATAANPRRERRPFSTAEIVRIFSHPIFSGCLADTDRGLFSPGAVKIRDERFWIPILLFLTGARANEIAGLGLEEVQLQENAGYLVFRYTQLRRLKNKESERVIPLHPWALKLGFFDYVRSLPSGSTTLFPDLVERLRDQRSGSMTDDKVKGSSVFRQFNRTVLKHVGLGDDPDATLHSFRHVYEDAMTGKDIPDEVMFRLTGRAVGSSRQGYTRSLPADSVRLAERAAEFQKYVDRIDFGGLDLGHLFVDGHEVLSEPMS